jgi:uncharacterized protein (TIRG00374 family)
VKHRPSTRNVARRVAFLAACGAGLYVVVPALLAAVGQWRSLSHLNWPFVALSLLCEVVSFVCIWQLDRIALHTKAWFPVITTQLTSFAVGHVLPGGGAAAAAVATSMLCRAGVATRDSAVAALSTSNFLQLGATLALPVLALPAIIGGAPVNHSLATAATLGAVLFALQVAAGIIAFATDEPIRDVGRALQWLLNKTVRRHDHVSHLPEQLLAQRDAVRATLGSSWQAAIAAAAGSTLFDYFALLAALRAVGADPRPSLVILAYAVAKVLTMIPLTPGGLGFVEGGLVGTLKLAGVPAGDALAATLVYRTVSYWLPLAAGGVAYVLFRRRYPAAQGL